MKEPTLPQLRKNWGYRTMINLDQNEVLMGKWLLDHLQLLRSKDLVLSSNTTLDNKASLFTREIEEEIWLDHVNNLTDDAQGQGSKDESYVLPDCAKYNEDDKTRPTKVDQTVASLKYSSVDEVLESDGLRYEDIKTPNLTNTEDATHIPITHLTSFEAYWRTITVDTVQFPTRRLTELYFKRGTLIFIAGITRALP